MQQELIERARRDEAAKVTTPTTPCPIGGGLAQFLQPKNELFMADKTTAGAEIVVKTEEMETPNEASTSGFSTSSGGVTLGQTPLFAQALFHHQGAIANGGAADNKAAEEEDYDT